MKLTREASGILGRTTIGMLALRAGRTPLVNPAVFSFAGGSIWMTTSRFAAKTAIAKKDSHQLEEAVQRFHKAFEPVREAAERAGEAK